MATHDITLACIVDYGGRVRGKGYLAERSQSMALKGVGLAPTNMMITSFGQILETPWGSRGDLLMMPDLSTETAIDRGRELPVERFVLCNLHNLDGSPWACCPRGWLKRGLDTLHFEFGLRLFSAFEHEFHYSGVPEGGGNAYALDSFRQQGFFLHDVMAALGEAGVEPEMVMPEYGPGQFEVTNGPAIGTESADRAVKLREIVRSLARAHGHKASFSPVMKAGMVGNGVHVHFSLQDETGASVSYDAAGPSYLSKQLGSFVAGILRHMPDFLPLTAASAVSYERLQPHRWSAAYNNLSMQDREAGVRVCPISGGNPERSFNVEYRACDATANPYLVLGALVWAGIDGLRDNLPVPRATDKDPVRMSPEDLNAQGLQRLSKSLGEASDRMAASEAVLSWMGAEFRDAYLISKKSEMKLLEGLDLDEQVARYADCF